MPTRSESRAADAAAVVRRRSAATYPKNVPKPTASFPNSISSQLGSPYPPTGASEQCHRRARAAAAGVPPTEFLACGLPFFNSSRVYRLLHLFDLLTPPFLPSSTVPVLRRVPPPPDLVGRPLRPLRRDPSSARSSSRWVRLGLGAAGAPAPELPRPPSSPASHCAAASASRPEYREKNSGGNQEMQSFNHRTDKRARPSDTSNDVESQVPEEKKIRGRNKLHRPHNGQIAIIPEGDNQFRYANYSIDDKMKKGPILGVILKQEYPPIIEGTDRAGQPFRYHASKWRHYSCTIRDDGQTPADRVKAEFWSIYSVPEELEDEADRVFEKYAHTQCKNMLYQARPTAVKYYYREIIRSPKSDVFACAKLLTFQQYMHCMPDWFTEAAWESICKFWCSDDYLRKRRLGQNSRKQNPDGAQNRGGSRPLVETQQYLEAKYGTRQATIINTYCCMKAGVKNCDSSGNAGPIPSERAQQLVDDYNETLQEKYPDNWQEQPFDSQIAYDIGGGLSHGRLAIGNGAVKKAPIIATAKTSETRPSSSRSYQNLFRRYEEEVENNRRLTQQNTILAQQNATLTRHVKRTDRVVEFIAQQAQIQIPPDMLEEDENDMRGTGDGSSHASANLDNISDGH